MLDIFLNLLESSMYAMFLKSFSDSDDRRTWICTAVYFLCAFASVTAFNLMPLNESFIFIADILLAYLYLHVTSEHKGFNGLFLAALPTLIVYMVSIPVTILLCELFYGTIDFASLANDHYILLTCVTQPSRALLFWLAARKLNGDFSALSQNEYIKLFLATVICEIMFVSIANLLFVNIYSGVDIAISAVCVVLLIILLFDIFSDIAVIRKDADDKKLQVSILESQLDANKKALSAQEDLYQIRHDLKHFISALSEGNIDPEMTEKFKEKYVSSVLPYQSASPTINYILTLKKEEAVRKGIDFSCTLNIADEVPMEQADLYLLLSNLLDNSIEHIGIRKRISVEIECLREALKIRIINSHDRKVLDENGEIRTRKNEHHGYGIYTVKTLLNKYHGNMNMDENTEQFSVFVYIPSE